MNYSSHDIMENYHSFGEKRPENTIIWFYLYDVQRQAQLNCVRRQDSGYQWEGEGEW